MTRRAAWLAAVALVACRRGDEAAPPRVIEPASPAAVQSTWGEAVLATVGDGVVTRERFVTTLRLREMESERLGTPAPEPAAVLAALVDEELLVREAIRGGLLANDETVRVRLVQAVLANRLSPAVSPSPDELRAFYDRNLKQFPNVERVRVRHILVHTAPPGAGADDAPQRRKAEQIRTRVARRPGTFEQLAVSESDDASGPRGGNLGFLPTDRLRLVLGSDAVAALATLEPQGIGPVVRSAQGFHVFQLVDRKPPDADPLQGQREEILAGYRAEKRERSRADLLESLRATTTVTIHDSTLAALRDPAVVKEP